MEKNVSEKRGNPLALLPIVVFLVVFIGSGILLQVFFGVRAVVG